MTRLHVLAIFALLLPQAPARAEKPPIPEPLEQWEAWATWDSPHRDCPTPYSDPKKHVCFWPSQLALDVQKTGGKFDLGVEVFAETWVPLPGSADAWPLTVLADGTPIAVVEHGGVPSVQLPPGIHKLAGTFRWADLPQKISVPREIGVLTLTLDAKPVAAPVWDAAGALWLRRDGAGEEADKPFLQVKAYALLEDGIPLWLRTEVELIVSGKSREEDLGTILPAGWRLAAVESPIPVAIDAAGHMKAQVRAGKWTVHLDAFRLDNPTDFRFAEGAKPAVPEELLAFRSRPDFRMVEITGAPSIDVSQTAFPDKWRELPVYRWDTTQPFTFAERMRGMGDQKPAGLTINREWWLDEGGRALTFRDRIAGAQQQIWRLDAAPGQDLGSVRSGGQGQLITLNPATGAPGVEIRTRTLDLEATGRMNRVHGLPATGWSADADALNVTLNLPPGWRLFALFGADWVRGDWLTAWSLLDLFLLLVFTFAVFRLWGAPAAALAFVAFGIAYHEPGAPRYLWLALLVPLALQRVVPEGRARRAVVFLKWAVVLCFVLVLVPFVAQQVQQTLYPQLEVVNTRGGILGRPVFATTNEMEWAAQAGAVRNFDNGVVENAPAQAPSAPAPPPPQESRVAGYATSALSLGLASTAPSRKASTMQNANFQYDTKARIQTGPGVPDWNWRTVSFGWNGPVAATQTIRPILIPLAVERGLALLRVALLLALAAILLGARKLRTPRVPAVPAAAAVVVALLTFTQSTRAQAPDQPTLDKLRERLLAPSDAYPTAADIPTVALTIAERRITIDAEIHTAIRTAVALPGRLPAWSPVAVLIDDQPASALRRDDGYLWVVLAPGVHRVKITGLLAPGTEWEWTFLLRPRLVTIDAPGWTVTGVRPDGIPEQQVFFAQKQQTTGAEASYDRQDLATIATIDRTLELGLLWQVRTTVTRLSPPGKAVSLRVPLLPGENVLTSAATVRDGAIDIRLGAQDTTFTWESRLPITSTLQLATRPTDTWVERWHLVTSPVWNVTLAGLPPTFEPTGADLIPLWQPWPGETVTLTLSRPEAIPGATVTVSRGTHTITLGQRQRTSQLDVALRCSLGEDFLIDLPADADITALTLDTKALPVRNDGTRLIVPLHPGEQQLSLSWKSNTSLAFRATGEAVSLPVESANITTTIQLPDDRWLLWAHGPLRGPAVRFWSILITSLLIAAALARVRLPARTLGVASTAPGASRLDLAPTHPPLRLIDWLLLAIGLTQVPLPCAVLVVAWLFLLACRGRYSGENLTRHRFNAFQVILAALTAAALIILITAVGEGLLGQPDMFVIGNASSRSTLNWYQARSPMLLPRPEIFSVTIWAYRFLMLLWALWLAAALIRWLRWGWAQYSATALWRTRPPTTPPLPKNPPIFPAPPAPAGPAAPNAQY